MLPQLLGLALTVIAIGVCAHFLGHYMEAVFNGRRTFLSPALRPVERGCYRLMGVTEDAEQGWKGYLVAMLLVTVLSLVFAYAILRLQDKLPLNPNGFPAVEPGLAFNTAVSFTTNTNWQNYAGEQTMSYLSQMLALAFHNFLSAATGISLAIALIRGLSRKSASTLGNFYVDVTRCTLYILLPIAVVGTLVFVSQGSIQNLNGYTAVKTLQGATQVIAQGPVSSQEVIKDLGTNGGGFFNANSAHPFENPNGFTNQFTIFLELLIPFSLAISFGKWVGNLKQVIAVGMAMAIVLLGCVGVIAWQEQGGNPALTAIGVDQARSSNQSGGNMEGKSVRFGPLDTAMFAASTTNTSTGAVDSSHDSLMPLSGLVTMVGMQLGEITPGGDGSGLYGMLTFAILAVFIAGLMVGRTPEFLGKKVESRDVKYASLAILIGPFSILGFTALSVLLPAGTGAVANPGPHGFSEILYAFSSTTGNNGSAMAGLAGNNIYWNVTLSIAMWLGRFIFVLPVLALAGSMVKKKVVPVSAGTFPTDTPLFTGLLVSVVLIVGALTFFPALALGPALEHLQLFAGQLAH